VADTFGRTSSENTAMSDPHNQAKSGNGRDRTLRELLRDRKAIRDAMQKAADLAERRRALEAPSRTRDRV